MNQTIKQYYGIIKQGSDYYLEAVAGPFDTRAGHDHRLNIVPVPATRDEAKRVLDAAYESGAGLETHDWTQGALRVSFSRAVTVEPARADMVECGECWRIVPRAETTIVHMGNYGSWRMCRVCQMHETLEVA